MSANKKLLALAVCAALAAPAARATNGYFAHGYGTKTNGLAGAGVALPQTAMAAASNPAGMVLVGSRMDLGAALFNPNRSYEVSSITGGLGANGGISGSSVDSERTLFLIPHFGRNWMLGEEASFGVTVYGNGGMNTTWRADETPFGLGTFGQAGSPAGDAGVDMAQLFVVPTYARKFGEHAAWGASLVLAYQRFKAFGLKNFAMLSTDPDHLTDLGYDSSAGWGAKVGILGEVAPGLTLGASYQSTISMDSFDKYRGLFAEHGDFDIPPTATVGLAWQTSPRSTLAVDVQWIAYSQIDSVGDPLQPALNQCLGAVMGGTPASAVSSCLGGSRGPGFGWDDITVVKIGYQWQTGPRWTWRVGFSHTEQPIPSSEVLFNILAPGVIENHVTFGFTRKIGEKRELNFAFMYAPEKTVSGVNTLGAPSGQDVELAMDQFQLELSYGWMF